MPMRAKNIIDILCEVDQSRRGFLKKLGTLAGGLAMSPSTLASTTSPISPKLVSPATVASATSPKLLVVASPETWTYGTPTGLPHADSWTQGGEAAFDLATQTTPLTSNLAKFFADKGYGFTTSGQLVLTPEKAKHVARLADMLAGRNHEWITANHPQSVWDQLYAEQWKAYRELQSFNDSTLASYKQVFGSDMTYNQDTIGRSEAEHAEWKKRKKKYDQDREAREKPDPMKYSRMDYAGGSEDVQGVDYTTQESVTAATRKILGES